MKLQSHNGFILVKPVKEEEEKKTSGGILLIDNTTATEEQIARGEIVIESPNFKKGAIVYFNKTIPDDILVEENGVQQQYFALQESDIMFSENEN